MRKISKPSVEIKHLYLCKFIALSFFIMFAMWSLATPIGSAADDNYHLPSIWCSNSTNNKICENSDGVYRVDEKITIGSVMCWVYKDEFDSRRIYQNASCANYNPRNNFKKYEVSGLNQKLHYYPSLFYTISAQFAGENLETSVLLIRLFWAFTFSLVVLFFLTSRDLALTRSIVMTLILISTPLILFLVPSTNPSSGQIIGIFAFTAGLINMNSLRLQNHRIYLLGIIIAVSAILAMGSRPDSIVFLIIISIAIGFKFKNIKKTLFTIVPCILMGSIFLGNFVQIRNSVDGGFNSGKSIFPLDYNLLAENIILLPKFLAGFWGYYEGFGWKWEPPINNLFPILQFGTTLIFVLWLLIKNNIKIDIRIASFLFVVLSAIPLYMEQKIHTNFGRMVQPRYMLPLAIAIILLLIYVSINIQISGRLNLFLIIIYVFANFYYFKTQLTRTVNGLSSNSISIIESKSWWWNLNFPNPKLVLIIFTLANISFGYLAFAYLTTFKHQIGNSESKRKVKNA